MGRQQVHYKSSRKFRLTLKIDASDNFSVNVIWKISTARMRPCCRSTKYGDYLISYMRHKVKYVQCIQIICFTLLSKYCRIYIISPARAIFTIYWSLLSYQRHNTWYATIFSSCVLQRIARNATVLAGYACTEIVAYLLYSDIILRRGYVNMKNISKNISTVCRTGCDTKRAGSCNSNAESRQNMRHCYLHKRWW